MTIETTYLPTHIALVARRFNVCSPDDYAAYFLETSYLVEATLKTLSIVLHAGLARTARDTAYRHAYAMIRGDGLGVWEQVVREITTQPTAAYLPPEFFPLLAWVSKKRNKPEDEWFKAALENARRVLYLLGADDRESGKAVTVKELISCLVQIRNKTKAHGAVGQDFYAEANQIYSEVVKAIINSCPVMSWKWIHLVSRESGKLRGIELSGTDPRHIREADLGAYMTELAGVHFIPSQSGHVFYCGDLIRSNRECTIFYLPNGGVGSQAVSEFIDYGSGLTSKESVSTYLAPPSPLPPSETEGLGAFDIQSNTFGNLPALPGRYVKRNNLEVELTARLLDKNHPIITLHGGGGMGKTSLALAVAHNLAEVSCHNFEHVVWFSARDVDLRPAGPSEVCPSVVDIQSVSKRFGQLFSDWGGTENIESLALALQSPKGLSSKGILFIFDNFETLSDARGLHKFLDEHTHLPNKALITSRERAFVADYPIEVRGMEFEDAKKMLIETARELTIEGLMTSEAIEKIYAYTKGHAYVMRVIVGEIAKDGRFTPPAQVMGRRHDIADAVFERSFNKLSDAGRNVFLLTANWKSNVSEVGLIVVLGVRGIDAMAGIDECRRLSLVDAAELSNSQMFYSVPQLARGFAQKKLQGDPDKLVIQQDLTTLQKFGVVTALSAVGDAESRLIEQFTEECFEDISQGQEAISRADNLLEALANSWAPGWRKLAEFRRRSGAKRELIEYALRRAVEEEPFSKNAWIERANFATEIGDEAVRISSLVSAVDADPSDVDLVMQVAFQLCRYVNDHILEIPKARRGVYLASVRANMQKISHKLDSVGLSRLAWLFLLEGNVTNARKYAENGCAIDSNSRHCLKIIARLDGKDDVVL